MSIFVRLMQTLSSSHQHFKQNIKAGHSKAWCFCPVKVILNTRRAIKCFSQNSVKKKAAKAQN